MQFFRRSPVKITHLSSVQTWLMISWGVILPDLGDFFIIPEIPKESSGFFMEKYHRNVAANLWSEVTEVCTGGRISKASFTCSRLGRTFSDDLVDQCCRPGDFPWGFDVVSRPEQKVPMFYWGFHGDFGKKDGAPSRSHAGSPLPNRNQWLYIW